MRRMSPYDILLTDAHVIASSTLIARNAHSLVPSDPPDADDGRSLVTNLSTVDEPPFVFYCSCCTADGTPPGSTSRWTTHTQRTHTRRSATSKPQRQLHWHAIFQVSRRTPLLRTAGATRARGTIFPSIAVVLRLEAQRMALTWILCGDWRKCRRWRHSASGGRTAGQRRYVLGMRPFSRCGAHS